ncbi:hypothetical protein COV93_02495 [Candidatus Woesearchaeota archaeon CG11_big_fil_rev_8_21_14_0_20_43_8]|nr:MAG: hypothetical protein COV93_02495 [Candidatus Woesearchaeota archaeon CG11_big_fil_rev_8_21_14_0_20_43_8]
MKKTDRSIYFALFILLSMMLMPFAVSAVSDPVDALSSSYRVKVVFLNQDPDPVEPGKYVNVRFKVENLGNDDLDDLTFEILPEYPFSLDSQKDATIDIGGLFGRQKDEYGAILDWKLRVDKDAIEGENEIKLRYTYPGKVSWITLDAFDINVRTHDAILMADSYKATPERVVSGNKVKLDITIKNFADSMVKDIKTKLSLPANFAPVGSTNEKTTKQIDAGKTMIVNYELMVDTDATSNVHKIPLEITYSDELGNSYSTNTTIGLIVDNPPKFVLNLEESDIYTNNKKGKVIISFSDVGFSNINFVRLTLLDTDDYNILSTPMVYLGNVEPDDYQTADYDIFVNSEKAVGNESLPLKFKIDFTDEYNKDVSKEETLYMPLYKDADAQKFGYVVGGNKYTPIIGAMIGILVIVFWLQMLVGAIRSKHGIGKKIMWIFLIVSTLVIGALLYYIFGRKSAE